jgi:DNA-directed RNA polymerase specialized sigma24 family protein
METKADGADTVTLENAKSRKFLRDRARIYTNGNRDDHADLVSATIVKFLASPPKRQPANQTEFNGYLSAVMASVWSDGAWKYGRKKTREALDQVGVSLGSRAEPGTEVAELNGSPSYGTAPDDEHKSDRLIAAPAEEMKLGDDGALITKTLASGKSRPTYQTRTTSSVRLKLATGKWKTYDVLPEWRLTAGPHLNRTPGSTVAITDEKRFGPLWALCTKRRKGQPVYIDPVAPIPADRVMKLAARDAQSVACACEWSLWQNGRCERITDKGNDVTIRTTPPGPIARWGQSWEGEGLPSYAKRPYHGPLKALPAGPIEPMASDNTPELKADFLRITGKPEMRKAA